MSVVNALEMAPGDTLAASFRDPAGRVFLYEDRVLRVVSPAAASDLTAFLASKAARSFFDGGRIVRTRVLGAGEARRLLASPELCRLGQLDGQLVVEHEAIEFPSYPYEWPEEMLHAAASLTLDLASALLREGLGLKDATPYNILFRGPAPVFIDLLSFVRRNPHDPIWLACAQFERTFLLPLLASKCLGLPLAQILCSRRDGLEPAEVYQWAGPLQKLLPPFLTLVSIPAWLAARHNPDDASIYRPRLVGSSNKAHFVLESLFNRLRRTLHRLAPKPGRSSTWSDYLHSSNNYSPVQFAAKESFVRQALEEFSPQRVLDVGSNTGHFSNFAAMRGARVVAIDQDPVVVGDLWRRAQANRLNILPLVVDLTRPTPGMGWRNAECRSFLVRARGRFDAVLMLAVIHHMMVSERVPLADILDLAAELTTDLLIIEFIAPEDSMFRRLTRGREALHADLTQAVFEAVCSRRWNVVRSQRLENSHRWLYALRKKA